MARCGSDRVCGCRQIPGPGIAVPGIGSQNNPWQPTFVGGHPDACRAVADCMPGHLGSTLTYNLPLHEMDVFLSGDAGNVLRRGTDGGLYSNNAPPSPNDCSVSVAGLPAAGIVGGYTGAGRLLRPAGLFSSYETAVRLGLDMTFAECWRLRDGAVVSAPFSGDLEAWTDIGTAPFNNRYELIDTATWANMIVQPSQWAYDPYVEDGINPNVGPVSVDNPDGGVSWYGWREASQIGGTFMSDVFHRVGGRIVVACQVNGGAVAAAAIRDEIQRYCLQGSTIGFVEALDQVPVFTDAAIPAGMRISNATEAAQFPPADLLAAGVEWVTVNHTLPDATIAGYVDAGLQVVCHSPSRHVDVARVAGLGARGVLADDPVYASGDAARYAAPREGWAYRTVGYGQLTPLTDAGVVLAGRGYVRGGGTTANAGWYMPAGEPGWFTMLLGWAQGQITAIGQPYEISGGLTFATGVADSNSALGFAFGAQDDRAITGDNAASGSFYLAGQRSGGQLFLHKYTDGVGTELASTTADGVGIDDEVSLTVRVEADQITVTRANPGGTPWQISSADTDLRGPYVSALRWTVGSPGFVSRFREVFVNTG